MHTHHHHIIFINLVEMWELTIYMEITLHVHHLESCPCKWKRHRYWRRCTRVAAVVRRNGGVYESPRTPFRNNQLLSNLILIYQHIKANSYAKLMWDINKSDNHVFKIN